MLEDLRLIPDTITFYIKGYYASDETGQTEELISDAFSFIIKCGAATFWIDEPSGTLTEHVIDNTAPTLTISRYASYSSDYCDIGTYYLYESETDLSTAFDQDFELIDTRNAVRFALLDSLKTIKASYTYYLKGTDITGSDEEVFLTSPAFTYTLKMVCGADTFYLDSDPDAITVYEIDNGTPTLALPLWQSYSGDCAIGEYEIYETREDASASNDWNQEPTVDGNSIVFQIVDSKRTAKDEYPYVLKGS